MGYKLEHLVKFAELRTKVARAEEADELARLAQVRHPETTPELLPNSPPFDTHYEGLALSWEVGNLDAPFHESMRFSDYLAEHDQQA